MKCRCRHCDLEWDSNLPDGPRACPSCKSYQWRGKQVQVEPGKRLVQPLTKGGK
jgi:predicted Zn-ribbon and HTH transcriptional regulator